nr:site-2 protease family protein [Spirulina sp. CS-785/01]
MIEILLLIFLGLISYLIVKQSVAKITTTPVWLLWLVLMTPPFFLTLWMAIMGEDQPLPLAILLIPFVICPILYWWLIQRGRKTPPPKAEKSPQAANLLTKTTDPPPQDTPSLITPDEEKRLRNCFPWGVYYLQKVDHRPQAVLCRGRLKSNPEDAYKTIRENVESKFGDRFLLIFQQGASKHPFFALVPNPWTQSKERPDQDPLKRPLLALALLVITLFTTTVVGVDFAGFEVEQLQDNATLLQQGLPYSLSLLAILGLHESSHYLAAVAYRIRTTLPYFIPMPVFLGTFGAFIQMRSPIPNRKALFDVAIAGPLGGFIVTLPLLIWGLSLSEVVPITETSSLLNFESFDPRFSLLMAVLSKWTLGEDLTAGMAINLHPMAIAAYLGIIVTALNLMPVGQLDGGHIVHAMYGQRTAMIIGQVSRLLMLLFAFVRPEFIIWAIILLFMSNTDEPALNDVTELDNKRDFLGLMALTLLVVILLPLPETLLNVLNL